MAVMIAFLLDSVLGDPYWLPHPIRLMGRLIAWTEKKLYREKDTDIVKMRKGGILVAFLLLSAVACPVAMLWGLYRWHFFAGFTAEVILCYYMLAARCLMTESGKVYSALKENDIEKARQAVSMIVGRDTERLDEEGIIKAAVETVAENTSDGVTGPLFYMALLGAAGGLFYKTVNTMDSMLGYKNDRYLYFGRVAAKLDDMVNYLPSRMTAWLMIAAAFLLRYDGRGAIRIWRRDRRKHLSPNAAQTEAVCAGALGLSLAGDAWYFGKLYKKQTIGDHVRDITPEDITRANRLMYVTAVMMAVLSTVVRWSLCFLF